MLRIVLSLFITFYLSCAYAASADQQAILAQRTLPLTPCTTDVALPIYQFGVTTFIDASWGYRDLQNTLPPVRTPPYSFQFDFSGWQGLYLVKNDSIDTTQHSGISFWINGGQTGAQQMRMQLIKADDTVPQFSTTPLQVSDLLGTDIPGGSTWTRVFFDFALVPSGVYDGFWIQGTVDGSQPNVYLDEIVVLASCSAPTAAPTPAPTRAATAPPTTAPTPPPNTVLRFANVFGSHMVLQRAPLKARIWGFANPSTIVFLTRVGPTNLENFITATDATGQWLVEFPITQAGGPYQLTISAVGQKPVSLTDVMWGDVFWCGGQSNMQLCVNGTEDYRQQDLAVNYPNIRLFTIGTNDIAYSEQPELLSWAQGWSRADTWNVGFNDWTFFAGACWFFGKGYSDTYPNIPVGLISSNWGGTYIEAWSPPEVFNTCPNTIPGASNKRSVNVEQPHSEPKEFKSEPYHNVAQAFAKQWIEENPEFALEDSDLHHGLENIRTVRGVATSAPKTGAVPLPKTSSMTYTPEMQQAMNPANFASSSKNVGVNQQKRVMYSSPAQAGVLWNAMVAPFANNHFSILGIVWWQGENNINNPENYGCLFPAFIQAMRQRFLPPASTYTIPFFFALLHPWNTGGSDWLPRLRYSQTKALALPKVFYGSALDGGDPTAVWGDIHARYKKATADRWVAAWRGMVNGENVPYAGPTLQSATITSQPNTAQGVATVVVKFDPATCAGGLINKVTRFNNQCPTGYTANCEWFTIYLSDGNKYNTTYTIQDSSSIVVTASQLPTTATITSIGGYWSAFPILTLYNGAGIPMMPFRFNF